MSDVLLYINYAVITRYLDISKILPSTHKWIQTMNRIVTDDDGQGHESANVIAESLGFSILDMSGQDILAEDDLALPEGILEKNESLYKADPARSNPRARAFTK